MTRYYRGPDEPGGDGDILLEVADGKTRRCIEHEGTSVTCTGYDEYPIDIDMEDVADFVWEIGQEEFEAEWRRHCGGTRA